jgi:hypothetical protein
LLFLVLALPGDYGVLLLNELVHIGDLLRAVVVQLLHVDQTVFVVSIGVVKLRTKGRKLRLEVFDDSVFLSQLDCLTRLG